MFRKQQTISKKVKLSGSGLHTGKECSFTIAPAEENTGIVFKKDGVSIEASPFNVSDTSRSTTLSKSGVSIQTVEHLLASLSGLGIDNANILVEGDEIPAFDGSALPICKEILAVGIAPQKLNVQPAVLSKPIVICQNGTTIAALPSNERRLRYFLDYNHPIIGLQHADFRPDCDYFQETIASARTFVLYEEVEKLRGQNLAKGGSLDNVIVVWPDRLSSECRMPNELACHKLLDLIGDISLAGAVLADIIAIRSGHRLNVVLAMEIKTICYSKGELPDA